MTESFGALENSRCTGCPESNQQRYAGVTISTGSIPLHSVPNGLCNRIGIASRSMWWRFIESANSIRTSSVTIAAVSCACLNESSMSMWTVSGETPPISWNP